MSPTPLLTVEAGYARLELVIADITTLEVDAIDARITSGHRLKARHVIHAVGPVWQGGGQGEEELLASCYRRSLELAVENYLTSIAYPAISTGVYAFPADRAARIATGTLIADLAANPAGITRVVLCCFNAPSAQHHVEALVEMGLA
jgi:O-acetyl-ADP-ribose deacetylase (regulator of RNase III)